ncbi:hypothetical protein AU476_03800 [Cupriavidus sp. UYMSc13B]|nr:hypothetical protein AU476_03800 [Cupriavidus sp. UYMSc13B]
MSRPLPGDSFEKAIAQNGVLQTVTVDKIKIMALPFQPVASSNLGTGKSLRLPFDAPRLGHLCQCFPLLSRNAKIMTRQEKSLARNHAHWYGPRL